VQSSRKLAAAVSVVCVCGALRPPSRALVGGQRRPRRTSDRDSPYEGSVASRRTHAVGPQRASGSAEGGAVPRLLLEQLALVPAGMGFVRPRGLGTVAEAPVHCRLTGRHRQRPGTCRTTGTEHTTVRGGSVRATLQRVPICHHGSLAH
jgi:hypothetical protein